MYPATKTFWLEPTGEIAWGLRRYSPNSCCAAGTRPYHDALVYIGRQPAPYRDDGHRGMLPMLDHDDFRWPTTCTCGEPFTDSDTWQMWQELLYRRTDTGDLHVLHTSAPAWAPTAPGGACWDATWLSSYPSPDGVHLMVRLANGHDWQVDSQASNCARPGEPHFCWIRHGDPRACQVTVDKAGDTCAAGAGSILAADYHGFLQDGVLTAG